MESDFTKEEIEYLITLIKRDMLDRFHPRGSDIRFETSNETQRIMSSIYGKLKERLEIDEKMESE